MAGGPANVDVIRYNTAVFDVETPDQAKVSILQAPDAEKADRHWRVETLWFADFIAHFCNLSSNSRVLDFGCGIGGLAKGLIDCVNCNVVGVDISEGTLRLVSDYVAPPVTSRLPTPLS